MLNKPIKRVKELQGISREHHDGLMLVWKINQGIKKEVSPERILEYIHWFTTTYLKPHFEIEEKWIFTILGDTHPMVEKALDDHHKLVQLSNHAKNYNEIQLFSQELEKHIRFEERQLFQEVQKIATQKELLLIQEHHKEKPYCETTEDKFWLS